MPRGEMLARMPASELTEWQAYEQVTGPLGAERDDILAAMVAYYTVAAMSDKKSRRKLRLDKLVPRWDRPKQDWRAMQRTFKAITRAFGGEVKEG